MSDPFDNVNLLQIIQEDETDADSPDSELLLSQFRENWEVTLMLTFYTGDSGTATENPTETVLTDGNAAYDADEHDGHSLVMIDGLAAGNIYTIDATAATMLTCTGDTLLADGVRSGDAYKIFYNLKNTKAHTHDGVDSFKETLCHIKVGTYTGNGTIDQEITGIGFTPEVVFVARTSDTGVANAFLRTTGMTNALVIATGIHTLDGIISIDVDGFSVDDAGSDAHPNKNSVNYIYAVWR